MTPEEVEEYKSDFIKVGDISLPPKNKIATQKFEYQECLILMDTDIERKIGVGNTYPF